MPSDALESIMHFAHLAAEAMQERLGEQLVAIYLHGSVATGDFVPNLSDLDLIAVVETSLPASKKEELQAWFAKHTPPSTLAGIDCELLTRQAAATPSRLPHWDTIIRVQRHQPHFDVHIPESTDGYSLLDLAMARERGCVLTGPPPMTVIAASPRHFLLQACTTQLRRPLSWDVINDRSGAILTACRSWLYLFKGLHATKSEAGAWAKSQLPCYASLIDTALAQRRGDTGQILENQEVKAFCRAVLSSLEDAIHASDMESHK
ncbi:aminoglycoside adenylyltransferase domain-containing protein [Dictyobacter aurantiacus]|uniref:Aminoglycoside nucleotidyltransferase ANT9 n=1 Tax=Dictyobacter aurantiacus TaxID=1936993 RepID=A0A401ZRJ9_9CHLR|nr:aminoglycoside adenylyltransferase domain-containing protein [Dictyobacter aurantiacus]GCE09507.1 aminoglycoside nucleotidyltransferase ANT9 [Dictyobacter aurantiacus]